MIARSLLIRLDQGQQRRALSWLGVASRAQLAEQSGELLSRLDQHKAPLLRELLVALREGRGAVAHTAAGALRQLGVAWPELVAIRRGAPLLLEAGAGDLSERLHWLDWLDGEDVEVEEGEDLVMMIYVDGYDPRKASPDVLRRINQHKLLIVKTLLEFVKDNSGDELMDESLLAVVHILERYGVRWPELAVIKRSVTASRALAVDSDRD